MKANDQCREKIRTCLLKRAPEKSGEKQFPIQNIEDTRNGIIGDNINMKTKMRYYVMYDRYYILSFCSNAVVVFLAIKHFVMTSVSTTQSLS